MEQAEKFIMGLSTKETLFWLTLLGASHNYGDVERAKLAASEILKVEPNNASVYVTLANTFAAAGKWQEQKNMWRQMVENNIKKIPGATWVTVKGQTERFYVDSDHSYHSLNIYLFCENIIYIFIYLFIYFDSIYTQE